jgi:hypothetical protein
MSVLVVERDVLQTRTTAFVPIVNHEAFVANLSGEELTIDIESEIPEGFYRVEKFFPAFGRQSLLGTPVRYLGEANISGHIILERPSVRSGPPMTVFVWPQVRISPQQAALAQYDNYFGPRTQFYTGEGLRILGLAFKTSARASTERTGGELRLEFEYELRNEGREDLTEIMIDVILPDTIHSVDGTPDAVLYEVVDLNVSKNLKVNRGMLGDGFSRPATGTILTLSMDRLEPGGRESCGISLRARRVAEKGEIFPLLTVQFIGNGPRIWPATRLSSPVALKKTEAYYRQANIILPDRCLVRFDADLAEVQPVPIRQEP